MEIKFIIYIVGGILYFFYKKTQDAKKNVPPPVNEPAQTTQQPRPIKPPAYNPLEEAGRELQRRQAAAEARKKAAMPERKPLLTAQKADTPKDIFIREKKQATFGQGADDAPVYEDELPVSAKMERRNIRLENEGIYKVETMEEARALADQVAVSDYDFDAKQAFIGSIIFERKY